MDVRMLPLSFRFTDAGVIERRPGFATAWRSFGDTMLSQIRGGAYRIELPQGRSSEIIDVQAGQAFLMPPGCRHRALTRGQRSAFAHFVHLHCRVYELHGLFTVLQRPIIFSPAASAHIADCHDAIMHCVDAGVHLRSSSRIARLLAELVEVAVSACPDLETAWNDPGRERLLPVLKYIQDHIAEPLNREALAAVAGLSVPHLHTLFMRTFKAAPMAVVRRERMQHARELLHWSSMPVAAVASACGFEDQYYFSRAFKRSEGMPPSTYRRSVTAQA